MNANMILIILLIILFLIILFIGRKNIIKSIIKVLPTMAVIIFNLTNWSIINFIYHLLGKEGLSGSARVAVDSAIVTLIFTAISNLIIDNGFIQATIRNDEDLKEYHIPNNPRVGKLFIDCKVDIKNKYLKYIITKFGSLQMIIFNSKWTSIAIDREEEYENIDSSNSSEEIVVTLTYDNPIYLTLNLNSNKTIKNDGKIKLKIRHTNYIINILLNKLIDIKCNSQAIVYRPKRG